MSVYREPERLHPPVSMSEAERQLFAEIVLNCDARHFHRSDLPLLVRYVEAACLADQAAAAIREHGAVVGGQMSPWVGVQERATKALVSLSMRLRLSPQARTATRLQVARSQPRLAVSYYETQELLDADEGQG